MKKSVIIAVVLTLFLSGCLVHEKKEVKIKLTPSGGEIWVTETGWKSTNEKEEDIQKDFEKLIKQYEKDELEKEFADVGVYILDKKIYLKNNKITTEYHGLFPSGSVAYIYLFREANEEIIHVMDSPEDAEIETNGEIFKTKKNTIIVWPSDTRDLQWGYIDNECVNDEDNLTALFTKHREEKNK
jgi:hypothetical protein